ncbi:phosphatidylinositol N-acetylglucosaminyltransferase subunit H-like [Glandiceps talaboti]
MKCQSLTRYLSLQLIGNVKRLTAMGKNGENCVTNICNRGVKVVRTEHDSLCTEFAVHFTKSVRLLVFLWIFLGAGMSYLYMYSIEESIIPIVLLAAFYLSVVLYFHFIQVYKESLLVMASTGLQYTTTYRTGRQQSVFIPFENIQDVVINEGITMHSVIYYLVVLIKDQENLTKPKSLFPIFMKTSPRISTLKEIYRGVQGVMWDKYRHRKGR